MIVADSKFLVVFGATVWLASGANLTKAAGEQTCAATSSTADLVECNQNALAKAELELTRFYKSAISQIVTRTDLDPVIRGKWAESVRNAQRAWITFRDRDCGDPIRFEWLNGSGAGVAAAQCRLAAIKSRVAQLRDRYPDQALDTPSLVLPADVKRQNFPPHDSGRKPATTQIAGQCSVKAGDKVAPTTPESLSDKLATLALSKGEFETMHDFEARQKKAQKNAPLTFIVTTTSTSKEIRYDADRERFVISKFAWDNIALNLETIAEPTVKSVPLGSDYHGLGLFMGEVPIGTYGGSNAYGATAQIVRLRRQTYGIFDRLPRPGESTWHLDFDKGDGMLASNLTGGIFLNSSRDTAQALKSNLRFAVELTPRPPFVARGSRRFEPRFDRPTDIDETTEIFIGKVGCLLVIDNSGTVLRTVASGY